MKIRRTLKKEDITAKYPMKGRASINEKLTGIIVLNTEGISLKKINVSFIVLVCLDKYSFRLNSFLTHTHTHTHTYHHHNHHHVTPTARISLSLFRHSSLSFIASGRSSRLNPVSTQSCPCEGVLRGISLMSSSLLQQQCLVCLVCLTLIVFVMGGKWPYRTCSELLAEFLCKHTCTHYLYRW